VNDMSLKAKVKRLAKEKGIAPQAVLQNHLLNCFLHRLSASEYKDRFVVKGRALNR